MVDVNAVAGEIIESSLKSLSSEFSYFAYPLGMLNLDIGEVENIAVVGDKALIAPLFAVESTATKGVKKVFSSILHVLMHCLFLHPYKRAKDSIRYDLACDITVGYILDDLGYPYGEKTDVEKRKTVYKLIIDKFGGVNDSTARAFCKHVSEKGLEVYSPLFKVCDHSNWVGREDLEEGEAVVSLPTPENEEENFEEVMEKWKNIAQNLLPQIGKLNPSLRRILSLTVDGGEDYKRFLKSFLRKRERIKTDEEEFDYISYYYGLKHYGNVPLIESLEYSNSRDYSDVVIAVDTSGSTDGEPIKRLLKEVFALIKSMETSTERYRIRIIQCDLQIQNEDVVHSLDEFAEIMKNYELKGGGGTDFRPVFDYLQSLKKKGEKIEGLIYFTDGKGVYPSSVPPFKTCFVILNENEEISVPHFAYKINIGV